MVCHWHSPEHSNSYYLSCHMQPPSVTTQVSEISVRREKNPILIFTCSFWFMAQQHKHDTAKVQQQEWAVFLTVMLRKDSCLPTAEELDFMLFTHQSPQCTERSKFHISCFSLVNQILPVLYLSGILHTQTIYQFHHKFVSHWNPYL